MSGTGVRIHRANEGQPSGQDDQQQAGRAPKFVAGPGFEIAVRADSVRDLEVTLPGRNEGPQDPRKPNDPAHRHESIEARLAAVEAVLQSLVEQVKRFEGKVDALVRRLPG